MAIGDISFGGTNVSYGNDADKPTATLGSVYVATDTDITYICYAVGVWEDITTLLSVINRSGLVFDASKNAYVKYLNNTGTDVFYSDDTVFTGEDGGEAQTASTWRAETPIDVNTKFSVHAGSSAGVNVYIYIYINDVEVASSGSWGYPGTYALICSTAIEVGDVIKIKVEHDLSSGGYHVFSSFRRLVGTVTTAKNMCAMSDV